MPQHKSAIKSVRQNERRRLINRKRKGLLKSHIKSVITAIEQKDSAQAKDAFISTVSVIDKLVVKGLIHKNNAARKKSRLWRKVRSIT